MLETFKQLAANQFEAVFCTLGLCVDRCPEAAWDAPVARHPFCQVAFHALFFADYYLGLTEESLREQPFHRENVGFFGDYEQLEYREPVERYERDAIRKYLAHCRRKAAETIAAETAATLAGPCGFRGKTFTRAELHVNNLKHVQHHAAQLTLRLRVDHEIDIPWVSSGWRDF